MFALALWDRKERKLLLARDRYGIKPLYYIDQGDCFAFGSEHKVLLAVPDLTLSLDRPALLEYFTFQNFLTDRTLLRDVRILPPGHFATLDLQAPQPRLRMTRYWDFHFSEPQAGGDPEAYREELERLFQQAVHRQLVADVELGSYLSGGMDSGAITAEATRAYPYLKTFTCGFDLSSASGIELSFDERAKAEAMSARFRTEHYEMVLKAGDMERVLPSLRGTSRSRASGKAIRTTTPPSSPASSSRSCMSGAGGDELFGGYPWRYYRAAASDNFESYIDLYYVFWQRLVDNHSIKKLFAPIWRRVESVCTRDIFRDVFSKHRSQLERPEDYINHSLYFEAKTFLHGLLVVEDKLSMAHSLETRVPFLDNDLVDFAMRCPVSLKLNNLREVMSINENEPGDKQGKYFLKTSDGKQILRNAMRRYIPQEILEGPKQGFSAPDASWFKGQSIDYVRDRLLIGSARIYSLLDREAVETLVNEHLSGRQNRRLFIWSLLSVENWLAHYNV